LGQHELAELAPRDVVAKACFRVMRQSGADHVYLDARHLGGEFLARRFPTITASCRAAGIDPAEQLIPVAPAAHYASGGVRTDAHGRTSVPGLYACGEVACTGVHGANRLASNSLLEGLVFARRIAADVVLQLSRGALPGLEPEQGRPAKESGPIGAPAWDARLSRGARLGLEPDQGRPAQEEAGRPAQERAQELREVMSAGAGVLRSAESLERAAAGLVRLAGAPGAGTAAWEFANLLTVATALVAAASARTETRGSHWREDFPETDEGWRGHLRGALGPDGSFSLAWERA